MSDVSAAPPRSRLDALLGFLRQDPANLSLIAEAAEAAADEGAGPQAARLIAQYAAIAPLSPPLANLAGVIALREGRFADAAALFEPLLAAQPDEPALRFNLAWARVMTGQPEAAIALIDEATMQAVPRAAALKVQALHQLGRLDEALALGAAYADRPTADPALMSALAVAAIDAMQVDKARNYAQRAGDTHEGLSTLGALALDQGGVAEAQALFDKALAVYPHSARALLGKGLALMAAGDQGRAAGFIEQAAGIFGSHLGSWVAAGWAYVVQGDLARARATFEHALALDDTFAETHGALAVLDILEGRPDSAKARAEVALRLDRKCFSAALAKSLLAAARGDQATAERIRAIAFNTPIGEGGATLGQAMARLNTGFGRP